MPSSMKPIKPYVGTTGVLCRDAPQRSWLSITKTRMPGITPSPPPFDGLRDRAA